MAKVRLDRLSAAQGAHFAALDPMLPDRIAARPGQLITARAADGGAVAGVLGFERHGPGSLPSLWSAREVHSLYPVLVPPVGPAMHALLDEWAAVLREAGPGGEAGPGEDSACLLTWPSRDAEATQVLLAHGFQPLSVLAVRTAESVAQPPDPAVRVRRAEPADLPVLLALAMSELRYSAMVGAAVVRQDAESMKRTALRYRLGSAAPIWLAERGGTCVGALECVLTEVEDDYAAQLRPGKWVYLNCLSVRPDAWGTGVGSTLVQFAHRELAERRDWYLYYNPPNPLSAVFWPRHGYRPLWTLWEIRPADALR